MTHSITDEQSGTTPPRNEFHLTLVALNDDSRPAVVRLRAALKTLLRRYRLRADGVRPALPADGSGVCQ